VIGATPETLTEKEAAEPLTTRNPVGWVVITRLEGATDNIPPENVIFAVPEELIKVPPFKSVSVPTDTVLPRRSTTPPLTISFVVDPNTLPTPVASDTAPPERTSTLPGKRAPAATVRVTLPPIWIIPSNVGVAPSVTSVSVTAEVEVSIVFPLPEREPVKTEVVGLQLNVPEFVIRLVDKAPFTVNEPAEIVVVPV